MSLFSSLNIGEMGMKAQAKATGIVSNNIANLNTTGYKRSDASFADVFANTGRASERPGLGVTATKVARIDQQGGIRQTSSYLDAGIQGQGFFAVKTSPYNTDSQFLYTRAGTFDIYDTGNGDAFLRNANGFFLYGWPVGANGQTQGSGGLSSLQPIQINPGATENVVPTQTARLAINLDQSQGDYDTHFLNPPHTQLPVTDAMGGGTAPHFNRGIEMYDGNGAPQLINFEFRKITGPGAHATSQTANVTGTMNLIDDFDNINAGDTFTINVGGVSQQYIIGAPAAPGQVRVNTVGDLLSDLNNNLGGGTVMEATLNDRGQITFFANDPAANISFTEDVGNPLTLSGSLELQADPNSGTALTYVPDPGTYPQQGDWPALGGTAFPQNWWEVRAVAPDGTELTKGLLNFTPNGQLNTVGGNTLNLPLGGVGDFANDITVDMTGFTQYGGEYTVQAADQDGAPFGERNGIVIRPGGIVTATYTNGQTVDLYRIPLTTFTNANGLEEVNGTAFSQSSTSGDPELSLAGEGGAGLINGATLENSNVELSDEFANLIISQRAYSASSQIISTVNEMTEYLAQLSR